MNKQNNEILRAKQVAQLLGVSKAYIWYKVNPKSRYFDPAFPKPFKISERATGWLCSDVNNYIAALSAGCEEVAK